MAERTYSVWVERIEVVGFKRLIGTFDFAPGLTLVVGPNEAGKSSLGEAFVRSIWGFERTERRRREGGSPWERCRPWDRRGWRLVAILADDDDRRLRAEWDFAEHKVRLLDALTGEDLSGRVADKRGDVGLGRFLTGVSFGDFRNVCLFDQHTLAGVQSSDSLVNALQRAVEAVETDVGVADADSHLKDFLNTHIGARSDTYSLLAAGPIQRELNERVDVQARIEDAQREETELGVLAQELRRRELQESVLHDERLEIERAILGHELEDARAIHGEALRQRDLASAAPNTSALVDEQLVTEAYEGFGAVSQAERVVRELEDAVASAATDVERERSEEQRIMYALQAQPEPAPIDRSAEPAVRDMLAALGQIDKQPAEPPPAAPNRDPQLVRYRELRGELLELTGDVEIRWDKRRVVVAAAVALVSVGLGVAVTPIALAGLLVALMIAATARPVANAAGLAGRLSSEFGTERLDDLERRAHEEDEAVSAARASAQASSMAESKRGARCHEVSTDLSAVLDAASAPPGSLPARAERYLDLCRQHDQRQQRTAQLSQVRGRVLELTEPEREFATRRDELDARRSELKNALAKLQIEATDLAAARHEIDARVRTSRELAEQQSAASGARQALQTLLAGRTLDDLDAAVQRSERDLEEHERRHPSTVPSHGELASLRVRLSGTQRDAAEASRLAAALQAQIAERESRLPEVPELREKLAELGARIDQRQMALEAIQIAREALQEAARQAHRSFAPHLQRALKETLPLFTANRYREVTIADDLSLSLIAPESGSQVSADCLSFATRDQIYLVQRLEIAKLLVPATGPVPLLLDEPFAEFDEDRERAAVQLLCREAEHRQVVVFSKDRRLIDLVTELQGTPHLIELRGPATTLVAA